LKKENLNFKTILNLLSKPYFWGKDNNLHEDKVGIVALTLLIISIIKTLFEINFNGFVIIIILDFLTKILTQWTFLFFCFGLGAGIDNLIKTKYLQFGWIIVICV
jgi:hypothetical protein